MKFDKKKHCGAATKNKKPCCQAKGAGTDHLGSGYCRSHAHLTPPKQVEKARPGNQAAMKHGLYGKVLTGASLARYQAIEQHAPGDILRANFALVQAKLLGIIEGDIRLDKESDTLMQAAEMLAEEGQLSPEFVEDLKLRLAGFDIGRLAACFNSTVNLANAAMHLDRMGDIQRQLAIVMNFLRMALRVTGDRTVRELGIAAIQELKLEAGLPVEEINALLQAVRPMAELMADEDD